MSTHTHICRCGHVEAHHENEIRSSQCCFYGCDCPAFYDDTEASQSVELKRLQEIERRFNAMVTHMGVNILTTDPVLLSLASGIPPGVFAESES